MKLARCNNHLLKLRLSYLHKHFSDPSSNPSFMLSIDNSDKCELPLTRIYQNIYRFSDNLLLKMIRLNKVEYLYNKTTEINVISYNIQQKGQCPIIVSRNRSRIDDPPFASDSESAKIAITGYLIYSARKEILKQIFLLLALRNSQKPWRYY